MSKSTRSRRVGDQIQRDLALLIQQEYRDANLGMITVSGVEVTRDFSHARVYVTVLSSEPEAALRALDALRQGAGFLRHELGRRIRLRNTPELHFFHDTSIEQGSRMSGLIDQALAADNSSSENNQS